MSRRVIILAVTVALTVLTTTTGCGLFGVSQSDPDRAEYDERFVLPNKPHKSPSGQYIASVIAGPQQNGVKTRIVVITDSVGKEVFHDDTPYSLRHGVGVTWLSSKDQLWILSSDIGTSYVQSDGSTWTKTSITPETIKDIPKEIQDLE
ncbi:hypothetical protein AAH979_30900 [Plantactinospora sp. ZYX-F-223]|uniref:hypothetical protein n=1 Tax=Plantactinospora sp. ZYX-F-223 TaxID=3144103 RepID=UPI0031FD0DB9